MVKPKTKPKRTPPADDDAERMPSVVPTSAFSIGDAVHHPMFGDGKVEGIEDNKLIIAFEGQVTKVTREALATRKRCPRRLFCPTEGDPDNGPALPRNLATTPEWQAID